VVRRAARTHSIIAIVTITHPKPKSSIGMSHGQRIPRFARWYTTIGADNLVNQPSTGTWKAHTIAIETQ